MFLDLPVLLYPLLPAEKPFPSSPGETRVDPETRYASLAEDGSLRAPGIDNQGYRTAGWVALPPGRAPAVPAQCVAIEGDRVIVVTLQGRLLRLDLDQVKVSPGWIEAHAPGGTGIFTVEDIVRGRA